LLFHCVVDVFCESTRCSCNCLETGLGVRLLLARGQRGGGGEPGLPKAQVLCNLDKWLKHSVCNAYRRRGILVLTDLFVKVSFGGKEQIEVMLLDL